MTGPAPMELVCLPFAGAGAAFFRPWRRETPEWLRLTTPQLPGREERFSEEPHRDVRAAVGEILPSLTRTRDGSLAIFGHSLGAVLAYELTCALEDQGVPVAHLVVSGSPDPWRPREDAATGLDDAEFLRRVREFAGYSHPALEHPEMRDLLLPTLRADVAMHEGYVATRRTRLRAPVTALRGASDALVGSDDMATWADITLGPFAMVEVPGGHMYLADAGPSIVRTIADALSQGIPS